MNERQRIALQEIAMLDQLEAHLLHMLDQANTKRQRRAILARLPRLRRLRRVWIAAISKPNEANL